MYLLSSMKYYQPTVGFLFVLTCHGPNIFEVTSLLKRGRGPCHRARDTLRRIKIQQLVDNISCLIREQK